MKLSFGQVETALAHSFDIRPAKRSAFGHRLKHFQKLRFPPGVNTGKGKAATYTAGHLILLGIALELGQLGLTPERAVNVILDELDAVATAVGLASSLKDPLANPFLLYCDPSVLADLMNEEDGAEQTFFFDNLKHAASTFDEWFRGGMRRMAYLSLSSLLRELGDGLEAQGICSLSEFLGHAFDHADSIRPLGTYWEKKGRDFNPQA